MLTLAFLAACAVVLAAAFAFRLRQVGASLRGPRIVTCPDDGVPAAVEVDIPYSAARSALGRAHFRLQGCSRWPMRARCGQGCLGDLEAAPEETRVSSIRAAFYAGKCCVLCGWEFGRVRNDTEGAALLGPDRVTHEWSAFAVDALAVVLRSCTPACRNCHVGRSFRRSNPDIFGRPDAPPPLL